MKRALGFLTAILLVLALSACSTSAKQGMSVKASDLSKETTKILQLFQEDLKFYDVNFNEEVKSFTVSVWVYGDGKWSESGKVRANAEYQSGRIAVRFGESNVEIYLMHDGGHQKYVLQDVKSGLDSSVAQGSKTITSEVPLKINHETILWVRLGTNSGVLSMSDISQDFRTAECDSGVAVTLTVSDKSVD